MNAHHTHPLRLLLSGLIAATTLFAPVPHVQANSAASISEDGNVVFGAQVDIWGDRISQSVNLADSMQMDWLLVEYDWARIWPRESVAPAARQFEQFLTLAAQHNIHILVSITNAPLWAMDEDGPNAVKTAALVNQLVSENSAIGAVELFPGANTQTGWGAQPDADAYLNLIQITRDTLPRSATDVILLAGGLMPATATSDIEAAHFLDELYQAGALGRIGQVSLRFPIGSAQPGEGQDGLARYERLRLVMMRHDDDAARVWVTGYSWPSAFSSEQQEHLWLFPSYHAMQTQLYIEAAFFETLNPPSLFNSWSSTSLIARNGSVHDALAFFQQASQQESSYAASLVESLNAATSGEVIP